MWKKYKNAFINGSFEPLNPVAGYNVVKGVWGEQLACTWHSSEVIRLDRLYADMVFVNGTAEGKLYLEYDGAPLEFLAAVYDCRGGVVCRREAFIRKGVNCFEVPASGVIVFGQIFMDNSLGENE